MTHKRAQRRVGENKSEIIRAIPAACADEAAAVAFFEAMRWGDTPACPRCGDTNVRKIIGRDGQHAPRFLWRCYGCKSAKRAEQFTWRIGTPAEDSRIPARHWVYAFWRATTSKKGVAALEIQRQTGLSYKSALFLMHRVRWAMSGGFEGGQKLTGTIEADETYVGSPPRYRTPGNQGHSDKTPVLGVVERGGKLRLRALANMHRRVSAREVGAFLSDFCESSSRLITDEAAVYDVLGTRFAKHDRVKHRTREYARGDVTTNTVESAFSLLKRGLMGIWHSVSPVHLQRYCDEVSFRYDHRKLEDGERMRAAIRAGEGRHLPYCLLQGRPA